MLEMINQVFNEDCIETMKRMPDKSIDLVLTDPPYGIGMSNLKRLGNTNLGQPKIYEKKKWDNKIPSKEIFKEIQRVSKHQIIFGGNYFIEHLTNSSCWVV